jgi:hypothetical protein
MLLPVASKISISRNTQQPRKMTSLDGFRSHQRMLLAPEIPLPNQKMWQQLRQMTLVGVDFSDAAKHTDPTVPQKPTRPTQTSQNVQGDFGKFTNFMKRLVAVPHSEIKAKLDAEKRAKARKPKRTSASRASSDRKD